MTDVTKPLQRGGKNHDVLRRLGLRVRPRVLLRLAGGGLVLAGLALLPLVTSRFQISLATEILILALFAVSFNLLFGFTGLLSFGHAAYFAVGAYTSALIMNRGMAAIPRDAMESMGSPLFQALLGGFAAAALVALVIGFFCVRLDEIYFAMLTLAFGQMLYAVVWKWDRVTGGSDGLMAMKHRLLLPGVNLDLTSFHTYYYITLVVVTIAVALLWLVVNSPLGLTLKAIRENPERTEFLGVRVWRYRLLAFVISGAFSGLAGALFAPFESHITPSIAFWTKSAEPVLISLLGGTRIFLGPAVGAAIFILLKELITDYTEAWMITLGTVLVLLVIFLPGGIAGFVYHRLREAIAR